MSKFIFDMDTGVDDSFALCYAIQSPEIELLGCTGSFGNVYVPAGCRNMRNILDMFGSSQVPVFAGEGHSLLNSFTRSSVSASIHGENGTGMVDLPVSPGIVEEEGAVSFIKRSIREYGKDLTIVTTGPMTNVAKAFKEEPELAGQVGQVVSMGGAVTVEGNVSPYAEANIHQDPEAAKIVFESGARCVLVPLDVTMRSRLRRTDSALFRSLGTESGRLFADMLDYYIDHTLAGPDNTFIHDPSAAICSVRPELFTMVNSQLTVVTEGEGRGRTVVDSKRLLEKSNCFVCVNVDSPRLEKELLDKLVPLYRTH